MNDDQILDLYFSRDERAISETNEKYGGYCMQIATRILPDRQDSEEVVSDTLFRAWDTIPPQRPRVLRLYLAKITRNLAFSRYRAQTAEKRGGGMVTLALDELADCVGSDNDPGARLDTAELTAAIQHLLQRITPRDRHIFIRRYFFLETTGQIAARYGLKESNVLMILARVRKKLKEYLIKEGLWL